MQWTKKVRTMNVQTFFSFLPTNVHVDNSDLCGPCITDKTFEIITVNSSQMNTKNFAKYKQQINGIQYTNDELTIPDYNLLGKQGKDKEIVLKNTRKKGFSTNQ